MNLKDKYKTEVIPKMKEKFGYKNDLAVPKIEKVVINAGVGRFSQDKDIMENILTDLSLIAGQKAVITRAKKAVSAFKTRKGSPVGAMVTLRRKRMYDFLDRLVGSTIPRIRDFRGLEPKSIDKNGNLTIGIREHLVFPEMAQREIKTNFGLEVVIVTSTKTHEEGEELLRILGFPIKTK